MSAAASKGAVDGGARAGSGATLPFAPHSESDVCLILEGTWPYVRGGVSSWVAQLLASMPELSFSVIFLGARADDHEAPAYPIPPNVVHVERHFLIDGTSEDGASENGASSAGGDEDDDTVPAGEVSDRRAPLRTTIERCRALTRTAGGAARRHDEAERFAMNSDLHTRLRDGDALDPSVGERFTGLLSGRTPMTADALARHGLSWETIREKYGEAPPGLDFNHFFWSVQSMHAPLFTLARIVDAAPLARLYHSVSTGYAGWLGAMLKSRTGRPFLISEHGIYTKERELDLGQVDWIPDDVDPFRVGLDDGMSYLRQVWIRFFRSLGRMSYAAADEVFTLYEGNRLRQLADGAAPERLRIIPNGVDVARFAAARRAADAPVPPVLALIGRVVPIKDIKTFVRAMRIVRARVPEATGWLVGPEDEDPAYTEECRRLVTSLGLDGVVRFLGFGKPEEIFPKIGLNVLTSVSEGQPLTVLEGFAAGVPALTTDVGSCRELVEGLGGDDRALGAAGAVVPIASAAEFAEAAIGLLADPEAWARASAAAVARVESRYDERDMIRRYRGVYEAALDRATVQGTDVANGTTAPDGAPVGNAPRDAAVEDVDSSASPDLPRRQAS